MGRRSRTRRRGMGRSHGVGGRCHVGRRQGGGKGQAVVLHHRPKGHIGLPDPRAKREERGHNLKFLESVKPNIVEKMLVKSLLLWPASNPERGGIETVKVSVSDEGSSLADGSPLRLRDHVAVSVSDGMLHVDARHVASRDGDVRVLLAVSEGPEN
jgi:hypothetical protein